MKLDNLSLYIGVVLFLFAMFLAMLDYFSITDICSEFMVTKGRSYIMGVGGFFLIIGYIMKMLHNKKSKK